MKNIDSIQTLLEHKIIIKNSKFLNLLYRDFYKEFKKLTKLKPIIEIGSGAGFIKEIIPKTITTDVVKTDDIDLKAFAEKLPFDNRSVGSILMLNVFHHIKDPTKALFEFDRILKTNGRIVMIEPANTAWSRFIYKYFHNETFDTESIWKTKGNGRMSDANGAIPWIVFIRDKKIFQKRFPSLIIKKIRIHTPFAYLISGGVSKFQPFNNFDYKKFRRFESYFKNINNLIGMFMTIVVEKK